MPWNRALIAALACAGVLPLVGCASTESRRGPEREPKVVWIDDLSGPIGEDTRVLVSGDRLRRSVRDAVPVPSIDRRGGPWVEARPAPEFGDGVYAMRMLCPPGCRPRVGWGPRDEPGFVHCDCRPDVPEEIDPDPEGGDDEPADPRSWRAS